MDKTVLLQKQIRDNSDDLRTYLQDLSKWEEDMKRKESQISSSDSESQVPLARNKVKKTEENKADGSKKTEKSKKRINSYDYASWDKFDVDAECEKIDTAKNKEAEQSEDEEPSEEYKQLVRDEAIREKEKGNQFVKNKKWDDAISCYTHAIACDPKDPIFFANRALCFLKKNELHSAEADCTSALQLDPTYVKALQRRAAARDGLKQLQDALTDLKRVLELEPHNIESKKELQKLEKLLGINKQKTLVKSDTPQSVQKSSTKEIKIEPSCSKTKSSPTEIHIPWPDRGPCEIIKPIEKKPHQRSKQPLRRVEIVETDTSELSINRKQTTLDSANEFNVDYKESNALAKILAQTSQLDVDEVLKDIETTDRREINKDINKIIIDTTPDGTGDIVSQSSECKMDEILLENTELPIKKLNINTPDKGRKVSFSEKIELIPKQEIFETENDTDMDEILPDENEECIFPVPKTAHTFYTDWCQIKNDQVQKNLYLKQIPPQELPSIFQYALESHLFSEMIHILNDYFIGNDLRVFEFVKYLSDVKRFSTMIMFATSEDKLALKEIFDYMVTQKESSVEDIEALKLKYEL